MNIIVRATIMAFVSASTSSAYATDVSRPSPSSTRTVGGATVNEAPPSLQAETSFLQRQRQKLEDRQAARAAAAKTTRYCAAPTYGRRGGKVTVINPGHCDTGGFGEHGEANTSASSRLNKTAF